MSTDSQTTKLSVKPLIERALGVLSERNGAIVAARHGIGNNGQGRTLESIGHDYNITRERVRQIEEASYAKIRNTGEYESLADARRKVADFLEDHCGVCTEEHVLHSLATAAQRPHLAFLLALDEDFAKIKESDEWRQSWARHHEHAEAAKDALTNVAGMLEQKKTPVEEGELFELLEKANTKGLTLRRDTVQHLLTVSKRIERGAYDKWGITHWPEVNPRGVRDKVYLVLDRHGKPLHFRELAQLIDEGPFTTKKKTHPQTVHNELIKDDRFVLIGRGVYALKDWGYMHGTVKDVIMNVLQQEGRPLRKDEIISRVLEQRHVQKNTILLNLQSKNHFARVDQDQYYLA